MRKLLFLISLILLTTTCACSVAEEALAPANVTYQVFVGSFQDSDGDGIGDLQGIIDQLDYIAALGVDRLWLSPIHPSVSYHKYDVLNYEAVDPDFGTLEDFDRLVAACRERGIGVMLDLVVNHTGEGHPWFRQACEALQNQVDSPYVGWYNFTQGQGMHPVPGTDWYYEGQFGPHMPDLNLDSPDVRAEIARVIAFWQARGVCGFRLDAVTSYYTGAPLASRDFLRFLTDAAKAADPDCYLVGEAWTDASAILTLYGSGVDSLFNFPAADSTGVFVQAALGGKGAAAARLMADWNAQLREASPASVDAPFLTNHDLNRAAGMLRLKAPFEKAAAMLYLLMPGRPTVYYGEELGMTGSGLDENKRLPMLWSAAEGAALCSPPAAADQKQRLKEGADVQAADPDSLLSWYRQVIALRRQAPELLRGIMTAIDLGEPDLACYRVADGEGAVIILMNLSQTDTRSVALDALNAVYVDGCGQPVFDGSALALPPVSCALLRAE